MAEEAATNQEPTKKKKGGSKTILVVVGIMVLEAAGVAGFIMLSNGGSSAQASELQGQTLAAEEETLEVALVDERFQNLTSGKSWTWSVEVVLQVKRKHQDSVTKELERRKAEITEGVSLIVRKAAHSHLTEPGLETLHRQFSTYIHNVFGETPEGEALVERVLIPKCQGIVADY